MTIKLTHLHTNNSAFPIWDPSEDDVAINAMADLLHRLKGRTGDFSPLGDAWYDYRSGTAYPVTGVITPGTDAAFGGKSVAAFTSGAYAELAADLPIAGDYTISVCYKFATGGNQTLVGSDGANYHSLHVDGSNGSGGGIGSIKRSVNAATVYNGTVAHAVATATILTVCYKYSTDRTRIYVNGALEATSTAVHHNVDATIRVGALGAFGNYFLGSIAELSIWARDLSDSADRATLDAFLAAEYL